MSLLGCNRSQDPMNLTFDQSKDQIARLAKYFAANRDAFHGPGYKETHCRQEFIDPFFIALGWDVRNEARVAPQYREVLAEESVDIEEPVAQSF
jgi:hypothetical protein